MYCAWKYLLYRYQKIYRRGAGGGNGGGGESKDSIPANSAAVDIVVAIWQEKVIISPTLYSNTYVEI